MSGLRILLWTLAFVSTASAQATVDYVRPGSTCDAVSNLSFCYRGGEFKFIGVNLQAIAHLDRVWIGETFTSDDIQNEWVEQLGAARDMGASVIRIFAPHKEKTPAQAKASVLDFMNKASAVYAEHGKEVKFIITLTDFYNNPSKATTELDDAYDHKGRLKPTWFDPDGAPPNYKTRYLNFINGFVSAPLTTDPRVFAWLVGNELQSGRADDASQTNARIRMLSFAYEIGNHLKKDLHVQQMVSTGFIGSNHAVAGDHGGHPVSDTTCQIYHHNDPSCDPNNSASFNSPFDFVYLHAYNNEWSPKPCTDTNCGFDYQWQNVDMDWANQHDRPYVVGEFGFNGSYKDRKCDHGPYTGGDWGTEHLPDATTNRARSDDGGEGTVSAAVRLFLSNYSADGLLQWGFMAIQSGVAFPDNKLGDNCSGMDNGVFYNDWAEMEANYRYWSEQMPAGASLLVTGVLDPPPEGAQIDSTMDNNPQTQDITMQDLVIPPPTPGQSGLAKVLAEQAINMVGENKIAGEAVIGGQFGQ